MIDTEIVRKSRKTSLGWAWAFIIFAIVLDYGYEHVRCINGFPVECSGVDFSNLIFGAIAAVILFSKRASIFPVEEIEDTSKWGPRAAVVACVGVLLTAFDGVGCSCW